MSHLLYLQMKFVKGLNENCRFYEICGNYENYELRKIAIFAKFVANRKIVKIVVVFNPGGMNKNYFAIEIDSFGQTERGDNIN